MTTSDYLTQLQTDKSNLVTNLTTKGITGLTGDETFTELVPEVLNIQSGANIVNGIIEQYKTETSTIDANTFVEFVNKTTIDNIGTDTEISDVNNSSNYAKAVALNDSKVFIAHRNGNHLYGIVCTISGTTITKGTDTLIVDGTSPVTYVISSLCALSDTKVFITHGKGTNTSSSYLYGVVCTINGTSITAGSDTQLVANNYANKYASTVALSNNKVFVAYCYGTNSYLYGIVCTIEGTTITLGLDTAIISSNNASEYISIVVLNNDKVFIAHRNSSNLYGIICTIEGTTITKGTDTSLSSMSFSYQYASAVALSDSKVFIAHRNDAYLYGVICEIDGTTITYGTDTQLSTGNNSYYYASAVALNDSKVFIAHQNNSSNQYLSGVVCAINKATITAGTDTVLNSTSNSGNNISAYKLKNNKVFVAHKSDSSNSRLNGIVCDITKDNIKPSTSKIEALTKTECTTSTAGDVWVLGE